MSSPSDETLPAQWLPASQGPDGQGTGLGIKGSRVRIPVLSLFSHSHFDGRGELSIVFWAKGCLHSDCQPNQGPDGQDTGLRIEGSLVRIPVLSGLVSSPLEEDGN